MAHLVSSWSKTAKTVPEDYIIREDWRAETDAPICKEIPVIDLSIAIVSEVDRAKVADQIIKALVEYRCFQVINHGVSEKLMEDAMEVYKEFFNLSIEDKEKYVVKSDPKNPGKMGLFTEDYGAMYSFWRDVLAHPCYPSEKHTIDSWPDKPAQYRKVMSEYVNESLKVFETIFNLNGEAIGIEKDVKFLEKSSIRGNYYPKSPDPSLTTGLSAHYDANLATLIQQDVCGLQIFKDGKWVVVEAIPNAFLFIPGMELQIISNDKFKATLHQVGTNAEADRLSIGIFASAGETAREPNKAFLSNGDPPKYKDFSCEEYIKRLTQYDGELLDLSLVAFVESVIDSFTIKD